ncbi:MULTISPECIES: MFS transporter [Cellulomonas]|uniref:MFS transporter n=1 Tax=Cellulomonas TaxID=1707 RepID=UPI000B31BD22|nr:MULTISPECIES: MFS transporter [Cellulomonas]
MTARTRSLLAVACGVAVAGVYAGQPVLAPMGHDLGLAPGEVGWVVAAGQLGYLAGLVLLVPLGDVLDSRRLVAAHLLALAAGLGLAAAAPAAWVAFAGLALAGLFAVVVQTVVAYVARVSSPTDRGRSIGAVTSGVVVGILGSRVVAGLVAEAWGWRAVYVVLAAVSLVLALVVPRVLPPDPRDPPPRYGAALRGLAGAFRDPVLLSRGTVAFFLFASFGTLWSGLAVPLAGAPWHLGETAVGLFGVAGLAGALGAARAGRWADRGRADHATGVALALLVASWVLIAELPRSLLLLALGVVLLDLAVQVVHVSNQHVLTDGRDDATATVVGAYMVFYSLGSALGATTTAAAHAVAGWTGTAALGAAFAALGLLAWALGVPVLRAARRSRGHAVTVGLLGLEPTTDG